MKKTYVWQMIKEAVDQFDRPISYAEIKSYINQKWPGTNTETITAETIILTVNHNSRIHYQQNQSPRSTNSNSPYDYLYGLGRGRVEKYNINKHGVWEIIKLENNRFRVTQVEDGQKKIYTPGDIKWFKNVTNSDFGEAYLSLIEPHFTLHFPDQHKSNILSPKIDDIIVIRQKVDEIPVFTHLVTPVDNLVIDDDNRYGFRYGRKVKIIAQVNRPNLIEVRDTLWDRLNYGGITQGNACLIDNISSADDPDELRVNIWEKFSPYFTPEESSSADITNAAIREIEDIDPNLKVTEGGLKLVIHLVTERNRKIVKQKKDAAIESGNFICEVCEFSFQKFYETNYLECHHVNPIGGLMGERETSVDDLSLVCANCHRMLHTKFNGEYLSIYQLRNRIVEIDKRNKQKKTV